MSPALTVCMQVCGAANERRSHESIRCGNSSDATACHLAVGYTFSSQGPSQHHLKQGLCTWSTMTVSCRCAAERSGSPIEVSRMHAHSVYYTMQPTRNNTCIPRHTYIHVMSTIMLTPCSTPIRATGWSIQCWWFQSRRWPRVAAALPCRPNAASKRVHAGYTNLGKHLEY